MTAPEPAEGKYRVTSPMQGYSGTDVIVGLVVLAIGMFVVAGLPFVF
ncbi:MAG: hypothetical protein ABEJ59_05095 [Halanaeroarchaeum sp.]